MCYAYKKQRRVICLLNKSPSLIDRKKCSSGENALHLYGIQVKKVLTAFMHTKILESNFMLFEFLCQ